jgi:phage terminase small subunit
MALSEKHQIFVDEYLMSWNATRAAIAAGYSEHTARQQGSRLLTDADIRQAVEERLAEKAMATDEVLARLGDHARGTMEDFLYVGPKGKVKLDLAKAARAGKLHLLHRYNKGKQGVSIELYDSQSALVQIGKHLGIDAPVKVAPTSPDGKDEWRPERIIEHAPLDQE